MVLIVIKNSLNGDGRPGDSHMANLPLTEKEGIILLAK
jgi:hypothetical protein